MILSLIPIDSQNTPPPPTPPQISYPKGPWNGKSIGIVSYGLSLFHRNGTVSFMEIEIQKQLAAFPSLIEKSARSNDTHLICYYLKDLAGLFHGYYNNEKFIIEDKELMLSRLFLLKGVKQVIFNGLEILGVSAPKKM